MSMAKQRNAGGGPAKAKKNAAAKQTTYLSDAEIEKQRASAQHRVSHARWVATGFFYGFLLSAGVLFMNSENPGLKNKYRARELDSEQSQTFLALPYLEELTKVPFLVGMAVFCRNFPLSGVDTDVTSARAMAAWASEWVQWRQLWWLVAHTLLMAYPVLCVLSAGMTKDFFLLDIMEKKTDYMLPHCVGVGVTLVVSTVMIGRPSVVEPSRSIGSVPRRGGWLRLICINVLLAHGGFSLFIAIRSLFTASTPMLPLAAAFFGASLVLCASAPSPQGNELIGASLAGFACCVFLGLQAIGSIGGRYVNLAEDQHQNLLLFVLSQTSLLFWGVLGWAGAVFYGSLFLISAGEDNVEANIFQLYFSKWWKKWKKEITTNPVSGFSDEGGG